MNEQLCELRECEEDFGGIPIILFCGDFRQFRPVQETSILVPSVAFPWEDDKSFRVEQRRQHDKADALWNEFRTVVVLPGQVAATGDPTLRRLLTRIRQGVESPRDETWPIRALQNCWLASLAS